MSQVQNKSTLTKINYDDEDDDTELNTVSYHISQLRELVGLESISPVI